MQDIICSLPSDFTKKILPKEYQKFKEDNTKANEILEKFFLIIQQTNNNWIKNFFIKNFKLNHDIPKDDDDNSQEYDDDDEDKNDELINEEKLFEKIEQYIIYQICLKLHTDRNNYKSTPKHRLSSNDNSYNIIQKIDKKFDPSIGAYKTTKTTVYLYPGENPNLGLDEHGNIYLASDEQFPVLMGGWDYLNKDGDEVSINDPLVIIFE
jgi:hypothetical protein